MDEQLQRRLLNYAEQTSKDLEAVVQSLDDKDPQIFLDNLRFLEERIKNFKAFSLTRLQIEQSETNK